MTELESLYVVVGLLVVFILVGALLPKYLPGLVRALDSTVPEGEEPTSGGHESH